MKHKLTMLTSPYIFLPASQLTLLAAPVLYLCNVAMPVVYSVLAIGALGCVAANMLLFSAIKKTVADTKNTVERQYLAHQMQTQAHYSAQLERQEQDIAAIYEEMESYLRALMSQAGRAGQGLEDIAIPLPFADRLCGNPIIDALLHCKRQEAARSGIELRLQIQWPHACSISNVSLVCAISNILDNAIEACSGHAQPVIHLKAAPYLEYLVIRAQNPFPSKAHPVHREGRGIGLHILEDIANEHQGHFTTRQEDGLFYTELILRMKQDDSIPREVSA